MFVLILNASLALLYGAVAFSGASAQTIWFGGFHAGLTIATAIFLWVNRREA